MKHYGDFSSMMKDLLSKKRKIHILIGNGFSMAYDAKIFSYNALATFVQDSGDPTVSTLFSALKTKNFELIMEQLTTFMVLLKVLKADAALQNQVTAAHSKLKQSLLDAVKSLHPEHVFKIPQGSIHQCTNFLHQFADTGGEIFSTNYDLLLYWVLMRGEFPKAVDGFGRELLNPQEVATKTEEAEYSELRWGPNTAAQNIHYLHGTLPFFDERTDIVKEQYTEAGYLLENISSRLDDGHYPIFVTAGSAVEKLDQIMHNRYLSHCYQRLCSIDGSVVTYGFGFGQYDDHIIDAFNKATHANHKNPPKLWSVYIGTYSSDGKDYIESIEHKFHAKVCTFDAKSVNPWH